MSGSMYRWKSNAFIDDDDDNASQYSEAFSDISADEGSRYPDIGRRMRTLFKEKLYTDVKFVINCGVKPKPTLQAHRAILAIGSEKFRELLYGKNPCAGLEEIQVNNVSFNAFKNAIEFLYTDELVFDNDQSVLETLSAAQMFQIPALINKCESYVASVELTEENVCSKYRLAIDHKLSSLKNRCVEFIQENTGSVLRSEDFLKLNSPTVRSICKLERFNLRSEIELLNGTIRWAESRPESKNNRRILVEPFLKHIRLLTVSCQDFSQFVQRQPHIFTAPETANILMALANPSNSSANLPPWCKGGTNRCTLRTTERRGMSSNPIQRLSIFLKPSNSRELLPNLNCFLELKCFRGDFKVDGIKLSFDNPVDKMSIIGHMVIHVHALPRRFYFEENIKIENSKEVEVKFSRVLLARRGDAIIIRAEAKEIQNYRFLQFEENNGFSGDSPFICTLGSVPKNKRLFFISEVLYQVTPPHIRNSMPNRGRRRPRGGGARNYWENN